MNVAVKGKEYSVSLPENLKLSFSKNLTVVDVPKLVLVTDGKTKTFRLKFAYAKAYNADGTINEDESRLYVTFNDLTKPYSPKSSKRICRACCRSFRR